MQSKNKSKKTETCTNTKQKATTRFSNTPLHDRLLVKNALTKHRAARYLCAQVMHAMLVSVNVANNLDHTSTTRRVVRVKISVLALRQRGGRGRRSRSRAVAAGAAATALAAAALAAAAGGLALMRVLRLRRCEGLEGDLGGVFPGVVDLLAAELVAALVGDVFDSYDAEPGCASAC